MKLDPKDKSFSKESFIFNEINNSNSDTSGCFSLMLVIVLGGYLVFQVLAWLLSMFD